jgi:hypothetical protein
VGGMTTHDWVTVTSFAGMVMIMIFKRGTVDMFKEAIDNLGNNLRGGPRPPSHPLPSDDRVIVLRRSKAKEKSFYF